MKTELSVKTGEWFTLRVKMRCYCKSYMEVFTHNSVDRVTYKCKSCSAKYSFLLRIRPPGECG